MDTRDKILEVVHRFITEHKISCPEKIYQNDGIMRALPSLMEDLCEVYCYYDYGDKNG